MVPAQKIVTFENIWLHTHIVSSKQRSAWLPKRPFSWDRYAILARNEARDRDRDAQPSPNARNTVERFVMPCPVRTGILTIHNVLDRYGSRLRKHALINF